MRFLSATVKEGCIMSVHLIVMLLSVFSRVSCKPIVDGEEIKSDDMHAYSFMSSLQQLEQVILTNGSKHFCGGTLIHPSWILTAAHCVDGKNPQGIAAMIGKKLVGIENEKRFNVTKIEFNGYDKYSLRNDIALVKISPGNYDVKVLALYNEDPPYGEKCKIVGYGAKEYTGKTPNPLSYAYVDLVQDFQCIQILGRIMGPQPENVCAMGNGTDTCQGDSGGPLICEKDGEERVIGITSSGSGCGIPGVPSLYTLVRPYKKWIRKVIENF